jgi:hypothetical protein
MAKNCIQAFGGHLGLGMETLEAWMSSLDLTDGVVWSIVFLTQSDQCWRSIFMVDNAWYSPPSISVSSIPE